jgi:hypothetical protein
MYAIGVYEGERTQTGVKVVRLLSVEDGTETDGSNTFKGEDFINSKWGNTQQLEIGKPYLMTFNPADQFANAISLNGLENTIIERVANRKKFEGGN